MNKIITLNGEEYLICKELVVDGINYIYAVSVSDNKYTLLTREIIDGVSKVKSVNNEEEVKKIFEIIAKEENI